VKARDWIWIVLAATAGGGLGAWLVSRRAVAPPPPAMPRVEPEPEPEVRGHREPVYMLRTEKPTVSPAGVELRWAKMNREAIDALDKGDAKRAVDLFTQCLAAVPSEKVFAANLAEALARLSLIEYERGGTDDRQHSLEHLARAAELAPTRADIKQRKEQLERLLASEKGLWTEASEHFELAYDGERSDLKWSSYEITHVLENAYQEFGELFGRRPVENGRPKIKVIVYKRDSFHEATGIGHWAGGLYDGTIRVPLENLRGEKAELERVLRHETAHAFVAELGGKGVPGWINEGLAQWLESSTLMMQSSEVQGARRKLKGKELLPLERLQKNLGDRKDADEIGLAYAEALALTAFIEHGYGERVLFEMVAGCASATPCETTFKARTNVELSQALSDLAAEL
jgi:hypothetical protein